MINRKKLYLLDFDVSNKEKKTALSNSNINIIHHSIIYHRQLVVKS